MISKGNLYLRQKHICQNATASCPVALPRSFFPQFKRAPLRKPEWDRLQSTVQFTNTHQCSAQTHTLLCMISDETLLQRRFPKVLAAVLPRSNFTESCACHEKWQFNITKYCACHAKWLSWLILVTYEMSLTMRGTTSVILQHHRILRLPRKMTVIADPRHMWNVISNARNNRCHPGTSANTAPATQNDSPTFQRNFSKTAETSFPMRGRSENDPRMIRAGNRPPQPASQQRWLFALATSIFYCSRSGYHSKFHRILRLPRKVTVQHHQILRLPRKTNLMIDPCHTWNAIYNARSNKCHCPNSPNTAPATQNDPHDQSSSHMKRYLQCAEQQVSLSKFQTHQILRLPRKITLQHFKEISRKQLKRHFQCGADPRMIRAGSENDPTMKPSLRNPPRNRGYFSRPPRAFCIENYNISRSGYHSKFHRILRLPRKLSDTSTSANTAPATQNDSHDWSFSQMKRYLQCAEQQVSLSKFQTHQILRLPRKITLQHFKEISRKQLKRHFQCGADPRMIRAGSANDPTMKPSLRNPPRNRGYFSRPPRAFCIENYNISRSGYHSKFHRILRLPRKVTLQLHRILRLPRKVTLERHQIVHLPRKVTLERHQILHLPRKVTLELHQTVHLPRKVTLRYTLLFSSIRYYSLTNLYSTLL